METTVSKSVLDGLVKPFQFKEGVDGLYFKKGSKFESGELIEYTITNFKKQKAKDGVEFRGTCELIVKIGDREEFMVKCSMSSLLVYRLLQHPEKYIDVKFRSYSTSPQYAANPLRLVLCKDGSHLVCSVTEGGTEFYTVTLPGGELVNKQRFVNIGRERYFRYYAAKQNADARAPKYYSVKAKPSVDAETSNTAVQTLPAPPSSPCAEAQTVELPYLDKDMARLANADFNIDDFIAESIQWARDNYTAGDLIQTGWNEFVIAECYVINRENGKF